MKKVVIVLASIIFISQVAIAHAETETSAVIQTFQTAQKIEKKLPVQKAASEAAARSTKPSTDPKERSANRCAAMTTYAEHKESQFTKMEEQISSIHEKLQNIVATFQAEGMDTSQLQNSITTLQTNATLCLSSQEELLVKINDTKARSCNGEDSKELTAAIKLAKSARLDRTTNCAAMRETFVQEVKPEVAALKAAYRSAQSPSKNSSTTR